MNFIVIALIALGAIGLLAAIILYFVSQKFKVVEDPRIDMVEEVLPAANCGGCGYPGCRGFADACVKADSLDNLFCPVGGSDVMKKVGTILGMAVEDTEPMVAVLKCNGSCDNRAKTTEYDGTKSCQIANSLYSGETNCAYGCLGFGDCELVCHFDALHIDQETGLPVIDDEKCTACGACAKACPKMLLEMRKKGPKNKRIWVACTNKDKGGVAKKACAAACIGCGKCAKECKFDAITIENNCAYIDFNKCKLCRKCVAACPTGAISELNFPPRIVKAETKDTKTIVKDIKENLAVKPQVSKVKTTETTETIASSEKIETPKTSAPSEHIIITEKENTTIVENITETTENKVENTIEDVKINTVETTTSATTDVEDTTADDKKARNIDDIVNNILKESNYTASKTGSGFVIAEDNIHPEPEIDIEALLQRKKEETVIDDIFITPSKPETSSIHIEESTDEDNKNKPQQLELL